MNYGGPVTVHLIAFTEQDTICGDRDGYDTTYRTFYVLNSETNKSQILGEFFGYTTERLTEPFLVEIAEIGTVTVEGQIKIIVPIGCNYSSNQEMYGTVGFQYNGRTIRYDYGKKNEFWYGNCKNMSTTGVLSSSGDTLNLQYSFIEATDDDRYPDESYRRNFNFIGVRQ
jgi:hypothetical protein